MVRLRNPAPEPYLKRLLKTFCAAESTWTVRLRRIDPKEESPLCTFLLLAQKRAESPRIVCHISDQQGVLRDARALQRDVEECQVVYYSRRRVRKLSSKGGIIGTFDIGAKGIAESAKYKIWVVDSGMAVPTSDIALHMGAFIVPQGREHEWEFVAEESQLEIARSNRIGRLVFVAMGRGHTFDSLESVQTEVAPFIMDLIPKDEKGKVWKRLLAGEEKNPILGVGGGDIGYRRIVHRGTSKLSGEFYVEDVRLGTDKQLLRRLVFMSNEAAVQSEARLVDREKEARLRAAEAADREWTSALTSAMAPTSSTRRSHKKSKKRGKKKGGKKTKKKPLMKPEEDTAAAENWA